MKRIIYDCDLCGRPIGGPEPAVSFEKTLNKWEVSSDLEQHEKHAHTECVEDLVRSIKYFLE